MTTANVHEALRTVELVRDCQINGRQDDAADCAIWFRKLDGLKGELFNSLELIGGDDLSYAAKRIDNYDYPQSFAGAAELQTDLLAVGNYLETIVEKYGTDPDHWVAGAATVQLAYAAGLKPNESVLSRIDQNASRSDMWKKIQDLERQLKDRDWLGAIAGKRQRGTFLAIITAMAVDKYGFDPGSQRSPVARAISEATQGLRVSVEERVVRDFLRRGVLFDHDDDRWNEDWEDE